MKHAMVLLALVGLWTHAHAQNNGEADPIRAAKSAEQQRFLERKKALEQQPASAQRDLQLREEIVRHQAETKRLSIQEQTLRSQTISDLKQKWNKVEGDWKNECTRHDAASQELEKLPDGPEKTAKIDAENTSHRANSKKIAVERNVVHEGVLQQGNRDVAGGTTNSSNSARQTSGTKITDPNHRGVHGDFDAGADYRTTRKMEKILNEIGVKNSSGGPVRMSNGVLETSPEFGMTVNSDAGLDRIGSAGHQARVKMNAAHGETYVSETAGAIQSQTLKDHLATQDHTKKAMHGLHEKPGSLVGGSPDGQAMVKGAVKAADQAGLSSETVTAIAKQNGIKNPEKLLDTMTEIKAGRVTIANADEAAKLQGAARDLVNASEKVTQAKAAAEIKATQMKVVELEAQGKLTEAQQLRNEVADYRAKAKASSEALASSESAALKGVREPVPARGGAAKPLVEPEVAPAGGKAMKGAGFALGLYGIYEGYKTACEELKAQMLGEPKNLTEWSKQKAELAGQTIWHGLGFGAMADIGAKAGEESLEQYKKDIASGKVSPDSALSKTWMHARGVFNGMLGGVKAVTYDAAKSSGTSLGEAAGEGVGAGAGLYTWLMGVQQENQTNEMRSKMVYDKLVKSGVSTMGAQRAAEGVLKGDFTEAKRLSKVMEVKQAMKLAAMKPQAEKPTVKRSYRQRQKAAVRREVAKKEQQATDKATDEELKLREIVLAKLNAKGLPTPTSLVDRLVGILEKDGMPGLEEALKEITDMQGTFAGALGGQGRLQITVKGTRVTGSFSNTTGTGAVTATAKATLQGEVDMISATISMSMKGAAVAAGVNIPFSGTFTGRFTGKGYNGSSIGGGGEKLPWSVQK